jgi:hypothetical protein
MLSLEQQMSFYNGAHDMETSDMLKKATELLEGSEAHGEFYIDGGKFLPLSVWANQGYDVDRIERLTLKEDTKEDRVLGKTFRVKVLVTGTLKKTTQLKRKRGAAPLALQDQSASSSSTRRPLALEDEPQALPGNTTTPPASPEGASSSSTSSKDSSDDSSSDSSSSKHKKKGKKGKKGKKNKKDKKGKKGKKNKKDKKNKKEKKSKKDEHRET